MARERSIDLSEPLVLTYEYFVVCVPYEPSSDLPCVHGIDPFDGAPVCGALVNVDYSDWLTITD